MLYLTRKIGESVVINDDIEVTVVDIRGKSIKLGFTFPPEASVLRREIYERIQEENRAAAGATDALADAIGGGKPHSSRPAPDPPAGQQPAGEQPLGEQTPDREDPSDRSELGRASRKTSALEETPAEKASQPSGQD